MMPMLPYVWAFVIAAMLGYLAGDIEAAIVVRRRARRDRRKLNHPLLLTIRITVCLLVALAIHGPHRYPMLPWAALLLVLLTMVHRPVFNRGIGMQYTYMGSPIRRKGDSWYDTVLWFVCLQVWDLLCRITRRNVPMGSAAPFILANTIEATSAYLLIRYLP